MNFFRKNTEQQPGRGNNWLYDLLHIFTRNGVPISYKMWHLMRDWFEGKNKPDIEKRMVE